MACEDRQPPPGLTETASEDASPRLAPLLRAPERFDLFAALRLIEAAFPDRARLGEGVRARDEPARLAQPPFVVFPPAQLADAEFSAQRLRISQYVFGLFGPQGPLPQQVTVRALRRRRQMGDPTLAHFADIFHHRLASLHYRAWARARPTVERDRPRSDRFARRIATIAGAPGAEFLDRGPLADAFVLHAAGLFAMQGRAPEVLERLISLCFGVTARIREFIGAWLAIPTSAQAGLGAAASPALGEATVGPRVFSRQYRFRIVLGPLSLRDFHCFLPNGTAIPVLSALVRRVAGLDLDWDLQLLLRQDEVPGARLSVARLDWTSWLASKPRVVDAGDVVLRSETI